MGCYCNGKYHYTNMISALATGQISYKDAMCEILKRLCDLENGDFSQVQANWTETDTSSPAYIQNKPTATDLQADWNNSDTNSYGYIKNKPTIPPEQIQADWTETDVTSKAFIKNKPSIPSAQVQSNWTETDQTKASFIQNKPAIPAAQVQSDWTETDTNNPAYIKNKPTLPSAQVQSDWTQTDPASVDYIKNKPGVRTGRLMEASLIPPSDRNDNTFLNSNGMFIYVPANSILFSTGVLPSEETNFRNLLKKYQTYPALGGSRGVNAFAMSRDPRDDINDWSIIQHWPYVCGWEKIDGVYYKFHFTSYINDYTCTIPYPTNPFYNFGFVADYIFSGSGLTWSVYKSAYDNGRTYSSVKYFTPYRDSSIDLSDVGLNVTLTNAGGYLGADPASGSGNVTNALTLGRYFNNTGNESMGSGLWPLQDFKQGSWFECELWVWL